jgi:GxxExxY protein
MSDFATQLTDQITGAALEVLSRHGGGLPKEAYQSALALRLRAAGLRVATDVELPVCYGDVEVRHSLGLLVEEAVVVEVRGRAGARELADDAALLEFYVRLAGKAEGLLLTFGEEGLRADRRSL